MNTYKRFPRGRYQPLWRGSFRLELVSVTCQLLSAQRGTLLMFYELRGNFAFSFVPRALLSVVVFVIFASHACNEDCGMTSPGYAYASRKRTYLVG